MSDFIKTFYTKEAYLDSDKPAPFVGYIIETGEVKYIDWQKFTNDFNDDFDLLDIDFYKNYFKFYK
jgi:hypothetical protein